METDSGENRREIYLCTKYAFYCNICELTLVLLLVAIGLEGMSSKSPSPLPYDEYLSGMCISNSS